MRSTNSKVRDAGPDPLSFNQLTGLLLPPDLAIAFSLERSSTVLSRSFSKWRSRHQMSQELAVAADAHLSRSVARKALGRWRSSTQQASKDAAMAAVASEFLLKRRAWKAWVESTRLRRRNEWVRQKNTERLHAAFTRQCSVSPCVTTRILMFISSSLGRGNAPDPPPPRSRANHL